MLLYSGVFTSVGTNDSARIGLQNKGENYLVYVTGCNLKPSLKFYPFIYDLSISKLERTNRQSRPVARQAGRSKGPHLNSFEKKRGGGVLKF